MEYVKHLDRFVQKKDLYSPKELEEQRNQLIKGLHAQDRAIKEEYERTHQHGVCPQCHMVIPSSGVCDCGYNAILRR